MKMKLNKEGKLNLIIISFIGILILLLIVKLFKQKDEFVEVNIQVTGSNGWQQQSMQPPSWLVDSIKKGSVEMSYSGKKMAEVLDIGSYEEGNNKVAFLKLRLLTTKNQKLGTYRYKQKPLETGSTVDLLLGNTRIYGTVMMINDGKTENKKKFMMVKVILYDRWPWFADSIGVGDSVIGGMNGDELQSKVISKEIRPNIKATKFGLVDVLLEMKLRVDERGGLNYFANYQPVKVGNLLYIPMKDYNLYESNVVEMKNEN